MSYEPNYLFTNNARDAQHWQDSQFPPYEVSLSIPHTQRSRRQARLTKATRSRSTPHQGVHHVLSRHLFLLFLPLHFITFVVGSHTRWGCSLCCCCCLVFMPPVSVTSPSAHLEAREELHAALRRDHDWKQAREPHEQQQQQAVEVAMADVRLVIASRLVLHEFIGGRTRAYISSSLISVGALKSASSKSKRFMYASRSAWSSFCSAAESCTTVPCLASRPSA